jgi:hypothetical protein
VEIEQFDAAARIHAAHANHARAAQIASSIVKYRKLGHGSPCGCGQHSLHRFALQRSLSLCPPLSF